MSDLYGDVLICVKILLIAGNWGRREKQETEATLLLIVWSVLNKLILQK